MRLNNKIIVIVGPTGSGKTTIQSELLTKYSDTFCKITTYTSRKSREQESFGFPYYFITEDDFQIKIQDNFFIEWVKYDSSYYGTAFTSLLNLPKIPILILDLEGFKKLKNIFPETVTGVLIYASKQTLLNRLELKKDRGPNRDLNFIQNELNNLNLPDNRRLFTYSFNNDIFTLKDICNNIYTFCQHE